MKAGEEKALRPFTVATLDDAAEKLRGAKWSENIQVDARTGRAQDKLMDRARSGEIPREQALKMRDAMTKEFNERAAVRNAAAEAADTADYATKKASGKIGGGSFIRAELKPPKYASGGKVRGGGAAKRGCGKGTMR